MKAFVCHKYGTPADLQLADLPIPEPSDNEIRVRVKATTINDWEWSLVRGKPYAYRLFYGIRKPKISIFGVELAGIVDAIGAAVSSFKIGDKVYGDISESGMGAWAEYVCVPETALVKIPEGMNFAEAAAIPHASLLAWQGLISIGQLEQGQNVLINGAGGGVGTIGLQICKNLGAHVTGVDHRDKLPMMQSLGYDEVIDYKSTDFTKNGQQYNLILDAKTMKWPLSYLNALKRHGIYVTVGGSPGRLLQLTALKHLVSFFSNKRLHIVILKPNKGLEHIGSLFNEGAIKPLIEGPFAMEEIPQKLQKFGEGKHKGKIVITI